MKKRDRGEEFEQFLLGTDLLPYSEGDYSFHYNDLYDWHVNILIPLKFKYLDLP